MSEFPAELGVALSVIGKAIAEHDNTAQPNLSGLNWGLESRQTRDRFVRALDYYVWNITGREMTIRVAAEQLFAEQLAPTLRLCLAVCPAGTPEGTVQEPSDQITLVVLYAYAKAGFVYDAPQVSMAELEVQRKAAALEEQAKEGADAFLDLLTSIVASQIFATSQDSEGAAKELQRIQRSLRSGAQGPLTEPARLCLEHDMVIPGIFSRARGHDESDPA